MADTVKFEHFEVLRKNDGSLYELGRGAMGVTYKAFDTNLRCHVALKVIKSAYLNSETARQRFLREARAAAALRHPNVATVFHLGREVDNYFYAMEFVDGETIEALINREGAVPTLMALKIASQVARALGAAQKQGLVHRDIKPSNVMFAREEGGEISVKVIDFGLAKNTSTEGEDSATLTTGGFLGTPHFASPEQLEEREIDVRSDIYSLGVTLWYMLAGKTPFSGSTAQVMSQHLNRDPPFGTLQGQPAVVVGLLRRMMAKSPDDRPQTPIDLRRELDECIERLENPAPLAKADSLETPPALPEPRAAPGAVLAGRYRLLKEITASDHGRMFRAERVEDNAAVAVLILHSGLVGRSELFTRLEQEVRSLQQLRNPAFQRILSLEYTTAQTFLLLEWIEGPALLDLLRTRRALPASEARLLLLPLADAFDELASAGLGCPDIAAHEIFLPGADVGQPVSSWAVCQPKFLPLSTVGPGSASPEATMVASSFALMKERGAFTGSPSTAYVYAVASLAYEMLGGVREGSSMGTYVPIPGLSEQGNSVLKRALTPGQHYKNARTFVEELADEAPFAPKPPKVRMPTFTPPPLPPPKARPFSVRWLVAAVVVLLIICGIVLWQGVKLVEWLRASKIPPVDLVTPTPAPVVTASPTPESTATPTPEPTLSPATPKPTLSPATPEPTLSRATPEPTLAPATPEPTLSRATPEPTLSRATPEPTLSRATPEPTLSPATPEPTLSPYQQALTAAEELQQKDDIAGALAAYAEVAARFPEETQPREALEMIAASLRARSSRMRPSELARFRRPLEKAAALDAVSAQMLLGEMLRQTDPGDALKWLIAAGNRGQTEAMVTAGQMIASGRGVRAPDLAEAASWFSKAAEKGDSAGMYALAECYLFAKGVPKDPKRAVELLTAAAALNNPRAMNLLGDLYRKGVRGLIEPNFDESVRLFSLAKELGFLDAQGNLGVLYIYGQGVPKDEKKAVALFRDGAEKGNALCMFFYAMCFEGGVGIDKDREAARTWYIRAAQGGNRTAIEWCKKNNIPLATPP
jgi:serine/threonine protein kinase/TPR repeat protein